MQVSQKTGVSRESAATPGEVWVGTLSRQKHKLLGQQYSGNRPSGILPYSLTPLTLSIGVGYFLSTQHETSKLCENLHHRQQQQHVK